MKRDYLVLSLFLLLSLTGYSQSDFERFRQQQRSEFNNFRKQTQKDFDEFRRRTNEEYADMMRGVWEQSKVEKAKPEPIRPEPPRPEVKPLDEKPAVVEEIKVKTVVREEPAVEYKEPEPVAPIVVNVTAQSPTHSFMFYGSICTVHLSKSERFTLKDATEQSAADAWDKLSAGQFDTAIGECLKMRKSMSLGDWGYYDLLRQLSESFLPNSSNEQVLLQMFMLTQSGYRVRIARVNQQLVLLMPFDCEVYNYSYIKKGDVNYYVLAKVPSGSAFYVFDKEFPKEKIPSLRMSQVPLLAEEESAEKTYTSKRYPSMNVKFTENKNLMDFYNNYPRTSRWDWYSQTSLSSRTKSVLYPILKKETAGLSELEAVNRILNFVQTAFEYQTDQQQFGYERPLFGDESFYYPYCDCEDRSILFSALVREVLKLDVVLLDYPGHIATAVCFSDGAHGAYYTVGSKKYTVCDPTYIGASVGDCMSQYKTTQAQIVKL